MNPPNRQQALSVIVAAVLSLCMFACASGPRVDISSIEAMHRSVDRMTADMGEAESEAFRRKLMLITLTSPVRERVHGLTVQGVLNWQLSEADERLAIACMAH